MIEFTEEELQLMAEFHNANGGWLSISAVLYIEQQYPSFKEKNAFSYKAEKMSFKLNNSHPQIKELVIALDLL